jgi:hypothetical protein
LKIFKKIPKKNPYFSGQSCVHEISPWQENPKEWPPIQMLKNHQEKSEKEEIGLQATFMAP